MNKLEIINTLNKYHFDSNKYMVLSGASMVLQDIKDNTDDIDISVTPDYYDYLLNNYNCELENGKTDVYYIDNVINFGRQYYDKTEIRYVDKIPVQSIEGIIKLKQSLNRDKDIKDLGLIDNKININSLALAYLGDAVYEIYIRKFLIGQGITKVKSLQKEAIKYVSANGQTSYLKEMIDNNFLTNDELDIIYRARNHKSHASKSTDIVTYKYSTGLEALIGYLSLTNNNKRVDEIMNHIIQKEA